MNRHFFSLGLTGYPLSHSLSPVLHSAALREAGFQGEYRLFPVEPVIKNPTRNGTTAYPSSQTLLSLISDIQQKQLDGLNVTIPHKQAVVALLDRLSPTARAIQAVNTIYLKDNFIFGDNTDIQGIINDLKQVGIFSDTIGDRGDLDNYHVLVLGAGGSARAVVYALAQFSRQITIAARRLIQAQSLINDLRLVLADSLRLNAIHLGVSELTTLLHQKSIHLIINTTPVGMISQSTTSIWPDGLDFPLHCSVYDLVYNPRETALMVAARQNGLPAYNGLGMLIEQARLSFYSWTGFKPSRKVLYNAVSQVEGYT
jgi:shikimate dehydrogenase